MLLPEDATMSALLYIQLKHTSCHISTHTTYRSRRAEHLKQTIQSTAKQHNETISVIVIVVAVPDGSCCHRCCCLHHSLRHSRTAGGGGYRRAHVRGMSTTISSLYYLICCCWSVLLNIVGMHACAGGIALIDEQVSQVNMTHMCNEIPVTVVNGQLPGPTIEVTEGDTVIVHVVNKSPYNLTIHWYLNC